MATSTPHESLGTSERGLIARRRFLSFLAATPLIASTIAATLASGPDPALAQSYDVLRSSARTLGPDGGITAAGDALNVSSSSLRRRRPCWPRRRRRIGAIWKAASMAT